MKISEVTINELKDYAKVDYPDDDILLESILKAIKSYIKGYTGLDDTGLDANEDLTIALFVLANEMYENRTYSVQNDKVNIVVKSILDMHCINLL